ncbi:hypothetical protein [Massilia sp. Mn16-1_5]|uniref:hypothetical protein n=1 Tax=Massilia sp. Mn16-1_5 TaxID=2079199 RepID=UPI0035A37062
MRNSVTRLQSDRRAVRLHHHSYLGRPDLAVAHCTHGLYEERGWLDRFYAPRKYAPAWNPSTAAAALWVLRQARLQGLNPLDYGTDSLQRQLRSGDADTARSDLGSRIRLYRDRLPRSRLVAPIRT